MLIFYLSMGTCEIFIFLIALLLMQSHCKKPQSLSDIRRLCPICVCTAYKKISSNESLSGVKYLSELTGRADALYNELNLQVAYIHNIAGIPIFFCVFTLVFFISHHPKFADSFNTWMRLLLCFVIIIITIGMIILASIVTEHLSSSHYYDTIYSNLPEEYRQLLENPLPENEYNFSHEDYCTTVLHEHYIVCLQEHLKLNRTRLSKSIGAIIISLIYLLYVWGVLTPLFVQLT